MQQLTDKELLSDALLTEKYLAHMVESTASQTDDPSLVAELGRIFTQTEQDRLSVYQAMHQRGWYNPQAIDAQQLQSSLQKLQHVQQSNQSAWQSPSWQSSAAAGSQQQQQQQPWTLSSQGNWQPPQNSWQPR